MDALRKRGRILPLTSRGERIYSVHLYGPCSADLLHATKELEFLGSTCYT
jgi:hypothetical protein